MIYRKNRKTDNSTSVFLFKVFYENVVDSRFIR